MILVYIHRKKASGYLRTEVTGEEQEAGITKQHTEFWELLVILTGVGFLSVYVCQDLIVHFKNMSMSNGILVNNQKVQTMFTTM